MRRSSALLLLALAVVVAIVGYRMGTVGGLAVMVLGGLLGWYVVYATTWSIPTIGDVTDRAREDGLGVPRDLREWDPDIRQDQHVADYLDRRGRRP